MKTALLFVLALLAGPVGGYLIAWAGCASGVFGLFCGHNVGLSLAGLTLLVWLALIAWVAFRNPRPRRGHEV